MKNELPVEPPETYYVTRAGLTLWLERWGITPTETRRLIESGEIRGRQLPGSKWLRFSWRQVAEDLRLGD